MSALCGPLVSARLLAHAGSKCHLACMPAATIQVLGAGPSLFMHLTSGTRRRNMDCYISIKECIMPENDSGPGQQGACMSVGNCCPD
jgi:hypothetical protein